MGPAKEQLRSQANTPLSQKPECPPLEHNGSPSNNFQEGCMLHRISRLAAGLAVLSFVAILVPIIQAQDKTGAVIVVRDFFVAPKAAWPYDVKQLRAQTIAELTSRIGSAVEVVAEPPVIASTRLYTLDGEIVSWRSGNAAKRILRSEEHTS